MTDFSLNLNEDQIQIQKWVHDFAEGVIRPVAEEWDEREEFPWPVVQEAAQIGLYGVDFLLNAMGDPTGFWRTEPGRAPTPSTSQADTWKPESWTRGPGPSRR